MNQKNELVEELQNNIILVIKQITSIKKLEFYKNFITKMEEAD